jgi:ubiquinone/menaquinone biosynthesis C-methylase UbiE
MPLKGWLYDIVMAPLERLGFARRRRALLRDLRGRVLEIGVGTGMNLPAYENGANVIGVDRQLSLIRRARRRRAKGQQLVVARAEALPFRDGSFTAAVGTLVFCSLDDPEAGLAELRRVLAPGGVLRVIEHVRWDRHPHAARLQDRLAPVWRVIADGCRLNRRTESLIRDAGFRVERTRHDVDGLLLELHARSGDTGAAQRPEP